MHMTKNSLEGAFAARFSHGFLGFVFFLDGPRRSCITGTYLYLQPRASFSLGSIDVRHHPWSSSEALRSRPTLHAANPTIAVEVEENTRSIIINIWKKREER